MLIGVGFLYEITGTLNMVDLAERLPQVTQLRTLHTAFAFLVVGIYHHHHHHHHLIATEHSRSLKKPPLEHSLMVSKRRT